ncbi:hypothetical protein WA158_008236 [Blastocystis sp. Blastoise]
MNRDNFNDSRGNDNSMKRSFGDDNGTIKRKRPSRRFDNIRQDGDSQQQQQTDPTGLTAIGFGIFNFLKKSHIQIRGVAVTKEVVEHFNAFLEANPNIKKVAIIGFGTGCSTEMFLKARDDITVYSFDTMRNPSTGVSVRYLSDTYKHRHVLLAGEIEDSINLLSALMENTRMDLVYLDAYANNNSAVKDLYSARGLCHSETFIFMENLKPYSQTGKEPFRAWDSLVTDGILREISTPLVFDNIKRCMGIGYFVADEDAIRLEEGQMSKVKEFWETEPSAVLWKYGNELQAVHTAEEADQLWLEMTEKNIPKDIAAYNLYLNVLQNDPKTLKSKIEQIEKEKNMKFPNQ